MNTGTVEDYTGKGTSDLKERLVRTPLPPCETLLDDPLRVLRAVRFASRLGFRVHPELLDAGRDPRVHEALCTKVEMEWVGVGIGHRRGLFCHFFDSYRRRDCQEPSETLLHT